MSDFVIGLSRKIHREKQHSTNARTSDMRGAADSEKPQRNHRQSRKIQAVSAVLAKLKRRIAYGWMEIHQGNAAAWILALCIGRLNQQRPSQPTSSLCFCHSTLHVLSNIADPHNRSDNTILFHNLYAPNLDEFIRRLGFRPLGASDFRVAMTLLVEAIRGKRIVVWIPHLSPLDNSRFLRKLIHTLSQFQSVKHIDDGMGFISRETLIYRRKYISPTAQIQSWDFLTAPAKAGFPRTSHRSRFDRALEVVRSQDLSLITEGLTRIQQMISPGASKPLNIVLASKLLDADICIKHLGQANPGFDTFYVPHYNQKKNNLQLASLFPTLPLKMPEFGLLGITETFSCRIFFGVTASVILLIELLLRTKSCQALQLVFIGGQACPRSEGKERERFQDLLHHYQNQHALRNTSIRILMPTGEDHLAWAG